MSDSKTDFGAPYWANSLSEVDREVARLASICDVKLLEPGVIERVLANDAGVCGTSNKLAFDKLRNVLMLHYAVRSRSADAIGETQTQILVNEIVEKLRKTFGDRLGGPPAGN
jgi:hypothetical protein